MSNHNINQFNERVRVMNQSNSKQLTMTSAEARALHTEIFELLGRVDELVRRSEIKQVQNDPIRGEMDGGRWD